MLRVGLLVFVAASMIVCGASCATRASQEDCQKACKNVADLGLAHVEKLAQDDELLGKAGAEGKEIAVSMAQAFLDNVRNVCTDECTKKGTKKVAQCYSQAQSLQELEQCSQ